MPHYLQPLRGSLVDDLTAAPPCAVEPLQTDSYIARSALQKSIRRGDALMAIRSAATLFELNPDVVWRRLLVTAMEDIGVGEYQLFGKIIAAQNRSDRRKIGEDWPIAVSLIRQACRATKCQAANDLINVATHEPALERRRANLATNSADELISMASDRRMELAQRSAAVMAFLDRAGANAAPLFAKLGAGLDGEGALYHLAYQKTRLSLAATSLILIGAEGARTDMLLAKDDDLPPVEMVGGVPGLALDQYTRLGRRALERFVSGNTEWRAFACRYQVPHSVQVKAAGELLFRAEGARLKERRLWNVGRDLYARSATVGCFIPPCAVPLGLQLVRDQLPALNQIRRDLLA